MPTETLTHGHLALGISRQAPHLRLKGQVADALNIDFDVALGPRKRPPTTLLTRLESPSPSAGLDLRLHPIQRSADEHYVVVYGWDGSSSVIVRVIDVSDGAEAAVTIDAAAQAYLDLNSPSTGQIRLATFLDFTLIVNRAVHVATLFEVDYTVTTEFDTVAQMKRNTPADDTYHQVASDYYHYDVDGKTFAYATFGVINDSQWTSPTGNWDDAAANPHTAVFRFEREDITNTGLTFTNATLKLNKAGAFASYAFVQGDQIEITGGTGVTTGYYDVVARDSDDQIELGSAIAAGNPSDVSIAGISREFTCERPNAGVAEANMHEVARSLQEAFGEGSDVLVAWTQTGPGAGYFTVTGPYRGDGAKVLAVTAAGSGTDLTGADGPFDLSNYTATDGTGTVTTAEETLDVDDRWTQVGAPGAADAGIDESRMPVALKRTGLATLAFDVDPIDWTDRASGDGVLNPSPDLFRQQDLEGAITAISVASPGVVTSASHGLSNGDVVHISNTDSTPVLDGERTVANVTADTFTVGVNTSVSGAAGNWTRNGKAIADAAFHANRLALAAGPKIAMSESDQFFNYYLVDHTAVADSDRIQRTLPGPGYADITRLRPFRKNLFVNTADAGQFELSAPEAWTPSTVAVDSSTNLRAVDVAPVQVGSHLYIVTEEANFSRLHEYAYNDRIVTTVAPNRAEHVDNLVPTGLSILAGDPNTGTVVLGAADAMRLYVYRAFFDGREIIQSAWTVYDFDDTYQIKDVVIVGGEAIIIAQTANEYVIEKLALSHPAILADPSGDAYPFTVYLDRQIQVVGTLDSGAITAISVANPGVITSAGHGLTTGDTVELTGTDSTPNLDGAYEVNVLTVDTFDVGVEVTGAGSTGTWRRTAFDVGVKPSGSTLNYMVYGPDFSAAGREFIGGAAEITGTTAGNGLWRYPTSGTTLYVPGDHTDGEVILGRFYDWQLDLSRPYAHSEDEQAQADLASAVVWNSSLVVVRDSGPFQVVVLDASGSVLTTNEHAVDEAVTEDGEEMVIVGDLAERVTLRIRGNPDSAAGDNDKARAANVSGVQHEIMRSRMPR